MMLENQLYHFYNQGNNKGKIFFENRNYEYFLQKFRKYVYPNCKVLAYCLMPNHFHFLIWTNQESVMLKKVGSIMIPQINNGFRSLLSTYAQAINKQESRSGSLFRQKTKGKIIEGNKYYPANCFHYIHQNPLRAGLTAKLEDWKYSSFQEYMDPLKSEICDKKLAYKILEINENAFYEESYRIIDFEGFDDPHLSDGLKPSDR